MQESYETSQIEWSYIPSMGMGRHQHRFTPHLCNCTMLLTEATPDFSAPSKNKGVNSLPSLPVLQKQEVILFSKQCYQPLLEIDAHPVFG